ncbi:hypothetical protein ACQKPE_24310 [Pseudomonas sp. NPDC089554]
MDPQQRQCLVLCQAALHAAGYRSGRSRRR